MHLSSRSLLRLRQLRSFSAWSSVPEQPFDPILGLVAKFKLDKADRKVNCAQGAYRTNEGEPMVLDVVREAEQSIAHDQSLNKEYLGVEGLPEFLDLSARFVFGDNSPGVNENRVAKVQCLSGTGSLRVAVRYYCC